MHGFVTTSDKQDRLTRKKDRLDRVWAPLRPAQGLHASDDYLSSSSSLAPNALSESLDGMPISSQVAEVSKSFDNDSGNQSSHIGAGTGSSNMHDVSSSHMEMKSEIPVAGRSGEGRGLASGRGRHSAAENSKLFPDLWNRCYAILLSSFFGLTLASSFQCD